MTTTSLSPSRISIWDEDAVREALDAAGVKPLHVQAIYTHLLRDPEALPQDAPGLPTAAVDLLARQFTRRTSSLVLDPPLTSRDGSTTKMLLRLAKDGAEVEAVIMRYDTSVVRSGDGGEAGTNDDRDDDDVEEESDKSNRQRSSGRRRRRRDTGNKRATLCVSSQVGCAMGCTFCATGTMGKLRSLSSAEILEQADFAMKVLSDAADGERERQQSDDDGEETFSLRNVVFMGMGEPLDAYPAVVSAVRTLTSNARFGLRRSAVTVSTVGVVPRIRTLARDLPGVSLALSLHAPTQQLRSRIVPSARAWPIPKLLEAVYQYQSESRQRVFIEYVLLKGVNDSRECGEQLGELLAGKDVVVNLIPWNPVDAVVDAADADAAAQEKRHPKAAAALVPPELFAAPGKAAVDAFVEAVRSASASSPKNSNGGKPLPVTVRAEKGQDIAGACGQLVVAKKKLGEGGGGGEREGGGGGKGVTGTCLSSCCSPVSAPPSTPARDIEELAAGALKGGKQETAAVESSSPSSSSSATTRISAALASWLGFR